MKKVHGTDTIFFYDFVTYQLFYDLLLAQIKIGGQLLIIKDGQHAATIKFSLRGFGETVRVG